MTLGPRGNTQESVNVLFYPDQELELMKFMNFVCMHKCSFISFAL